MRIAIIGSRGITPSEEDFVRALGRLPGRPTEVVTGGAAGVDQAAEAFARKRGFPLRVIRPDYPRFGRGAPLRRNDAIVAAADSVVAFWDGRSRGTAYVIRRSSELGKPVFIEKIP